MKTIMDRNPNDSLSISSRHFNWREKPEDDYDEETRLPELDLAVPKRKPPRTAVVARLRSVLSFGTKKRAGGGNLGTRVVGTLFGYRHGHVLFSFQDDPKLCPAFLVEMAMHTSVLVREMASGAVRVALECDKGTGKKPGRILEEPVWRTYCNARRYGFAVKRECGPDEWKVLNSIGPVSMGAGVLPSKESDGVMPAGEMTYMRAMFERVVGSKDSEAFYMMNPDGHGGPEFSLYLLRV